MVLRVISGRGSIPWAEGTRACQSTSRGAVGHPIFPQGVSAATLDGILTGTNSLGRGCG